MIASSGTVCFVQWIKQSQAPLDNILTFHKQSWTQVNWKNCLISACLHEFFGCCWFFMLLEETIEWMPPSTLMVFLSNKQLGSTSPSIVVHCSKIGHSYEAYTHLFGRNIFICLHSANKKCFVELWKLRNTGQVGWDKNLSYHNKVYKSQGHKVNLVMVVVYILFLSHLPAILTFKKI